MQEERKSERRKERIGAHRFEKVFSWFEKKNLSFASILLLFISSFIFVSSCANNKKGKTASELLSLKDSFEDVKEFVLDEKTGQEIAKDQILIYIAGKDRADVENKKSKVSQIITARKGEFSILGEIEFLSEKGGIGVLLQARVPAGTSEEIKEIVSEVGFAGDGIRAFPNMRMKPSAILGGYVPLDPLFDSWDETPEGNNWHFEAVNMPKLWNLETRGKVPVAVIDFGIRKHEDLEYDLRRGVDGEGADWAQNHGVSVLGVLGAVGNNSKGIAGVIWGGDIKAYVIDGALSSLVQSIVLALQDKAKVILFAGGLGWGSISPEGNPDAEAILEYHRQIFSVVFQYVRYYDALFVQSAGNEGRDAKWVGVGASVKDLFPQNILLVGAVDITGRISTFSNRGKLVDLYLPGESIFTTCLGEGESSNYGSYCVVRGTSYSAALGAGVAVLLRSINQDLKAGDVKGLILKGVRVEGEGDNARYVIDFSISGNLARVAKPSEYEEISEPLPELPPIEDRRGGYLEPKSVEGAVYDSTYKAPKCPTDVLGCSTYGLVDGNDNASGYAEPNQPNTLYDSCSDRAGTGTNAGVRIISIQVESVAESGFIQSGPNASTDRRSIKVTVRAWCNDTTNQWIDVLYTQNADSPSFTYIGSMRCGCGGGREGCNGGACPGFSNPPVLRRFCSVSGNETSVNFIMTLPTVSPLPRNMAIRARIQNSGDRKMGECYNPNDPTKIYDHDDLVFTVQNPPPSFTCGVYNSSFQAPVCYGDGWCGTCNLVPCRDTVNDAAESPKLANNDAAFFQCQNGGNEPNQPNTLFSQCLDDDGRDNRNGNLEDQIRRINIRSLATSGKFEGGENVEILWLVTCDRNSNSEMILAYASGVTYSPSPITNWRYITTVQCPEGGVNDYWYNMSYVLRLDNVEGWHAVRVLDGRNPSTTPVTGDICPSSYTYLDADDFIFYVKAKPPSSLPVCATYDNTDADGDPQYRAPKCPAGADACSTCDLIKSRDGLSGTDESGQPNTLFGSCLDDGPATPGYLQTESIERIEIIDLSGTGTFQPGGQVEVSVLVYCDPKHPNYLNDYLVLLYSPDADSPEFTRILTATCTTSGFNLLIRTTITLANQPGNHVIRAMFQQGAFSSGETCAGGGSGQDGDTDDLVFIVGVPQAPQNFKAQGVAPDSITLSWSDVQGETQYQLRWTDNFDDPDFSKWITHPASPLSADTTWYVDQPLPEGTNRCYALRACNSNGCSNFVWDCATVPSLSAICAVYDPVWRVPRCDGGTNNCSTCDLVVSRDSLPSRPEQNTPNAWYSSSCVDGSGGDWYSSRSIEKITLTTTESSFSPGYPISVTVRVFCSSTADYVHLYVSAGTLPISWSQAGISPSPPLQACPPSALNRVTDITFTFTPPSGSDNWYVIRAVVTGPTPSTCPGGSYDELDDVAVRVGGVPPTPSGFNVTFVSPDIARVVWSGVAGATYYQLVSAPSVAGPFTEDTPHSPLAATTQHDHAGLQPGQTLCFQLRACNAVGCSAPTPVKCTTADPAPYEEARYCPYSSDPGNIIFSVISAEIRNDYAGREIFAVNNTGTATRAYLISGSGSTAGQVIWSYSVGQVVWSVPATGDIDGDSQPEIVIGVDDGRVMVFGSNGFRTQVSLCGRVRAVTLANVDADSQYEIIAVAKICNRVYVLDWDSSILRLRELRRFDLESGSDNNSYAVWFGGKIYVTGLNGKLYIFDYGTDTATTVNIVLGYGLDTPAIGDVDGDGAKEVVFGGRDGKVYIRSVGTGNPEGSVDLSSYVSSATCFRVSLGDANNNDRDEIYVVATDCGNTGNSYIIGIEWNGTSNSYQVKWVRGPYGDINVSHAVIADINLDGYGEIIFINHEGKMYIYKHDGNVLFLATLNFGGNGGRGGVSLIDVDGDGKQNFVFGDRSGCIHVYEFGKENSASGTIWWGYNRQNPQQNGVR
jgi:hypothetical protein